MQHGHFNVPYTHPGNPKLNDWAPKVQRQHKRLQQQNHSLMLTMEVVGALDVPGFTWDFEMNVPNPSVHITSHSSSLTPMVFDYSSTTLHLVVPLANNMVAIPSLAVLRSGTVLHNVSTFLECNGVHHIHATILCMTPTTLHRCLCLFTSGCYGSNVSVPVHNLLCCFSMT